MASAQEVSNRIAYIKAQIDSCLQRCQNAPYSSFERIKKIQNLQDEATAISARANDEIRRLEAPFRDAYDKIARQLEDKHRDLNELSRRRQNLQNVHSARSQEFDLRAQDASARGLVYTDTNNLWQKQNLEFQKESSVIQRESAEIQAEISDLHAQQQKEQIRINEESLRIRSTPATETMLASELEVQSLLDKAGTLEKEIASGANVELIQKATATFSGKTGDFTEAENHHKNQAWIMFAAMFAVLVLPAAAVYYLFISFHVSPEFATASAPPAVVGESASTSKTILNIERIVVLAAGRIAILLFLAWALKYLADLHRAHSEQAIIYRDRKAALGVAELLLNATPELEQKREMLRTLTTVYLTSHDSAFVKRRLSAKEEELSVDVQIKRMKETVEAVKPVLDAVGKASEKSRNS